MHGLFILTALLAVSTSAAAQSRAERERGEALVQLHCGGCHAVGPSGKSRNPAAPPFRELHRRYSIDNLATALSEGMLVGHPAMPSFHFDQAEVNAIVAYLRSIQTNEQAALASRGPDAPNEKAAAYEKGAAKRPPRTS